MLNKKLDCESIKLRTNRSFIIKRMKTTEFWIYIQRNKKWKALKLMVKTSTISNIKTTVLVADSKNYNILCTKIAEKDV